MPRRNQIIATGEIYHLFNRSIADEEIFVNKRDLNLIIDIIDYYRYQQNIRFSKYQTLPLKIKTDYINIILEHTPLVEIYSFALMPNHYHLLIKQLQDKGIRIFISNFQNSFAKYFNIKYNRHGSLFENSFRAKRIYSDELFLHINRYIHLNPVTAYQINIDKLRTYPYTSFSWYLNSDLNKFINTDELLGNFKSKDGFEKYVYDQVDYQRELNRIKKFLKDS